MSLVPPSYTWDDPVSQEEKHKKDPINLLFRNTDLSNVLVHLNGKGWHYRGRLRDPARDQYIPDKPPRKVQAAHRMLGDIFRRYHIRIWEYGGQLVANAHYETLRHYGHEVHHHEGAEKKVADGFNTESWIVRRDAEYLGNLDLVRYNNGYATVIER